MWICITLPIKQTLLLAYCDTYHSTDVGQFKDFVVMNPDGVIYGEVVFLKCRKKSQRNRSHGLKSCNTCENKSRIGESFGNCVIVTSSESFQCTEITISWLVVENFSNTVRVQQNRKQVLLKLFPRLVWRFNASVQQWRCPSKPLVFLCQSWCCCTFPLPAVAPPSAPQWLPTHMVSKHVWDVIRC